MVNNKYRGIQLKSPLYIDTPVQSQLVFLAGVQRAEPVVGEEMRDGPVVFTHICTSPLDINMVVDCLINTTI